jgi:hypothetical protein
MASHWLGQIGSGKQVGLQLGVLAGLVATMLGPSTRESGAAPPPNCSNDEDMCSFKRPMFLVVLDYSTSMNKVFADQETRWEAAVNAIKYMVVADNGFLVRNFMPGLLRFGHDPDPQAPGTLIVGDSSGLVDGQALDVALYAGDPGHTWHGCDAGDLMASALDSLPPPKDGQPTGIGTWTKGALDFARAHLDQAAVDHPEDQGLRRAALLVLTDGAWTDATGTMPLTPASENPAITAGALWADAQTPTYVVAIGEAWGKQFADELAVAGGTGAALDAMNPQALIDALGQVVQSLEDEIVQPSCSVSMPRIMLLLDASSSMLNINGGTLRAPLGQGGWEQARDAIAGVDSLFDQPVALGNHKVQDLTQIGLAVFGHNQPAEEQLLVQYAPCNKDNFAWALDPANSCVAPGCTDPYANPPIVWTFQDGSLIPPLFEESTITHMPRCDFAAQNPFACVGSGTYTHLGLNLVRSNIAAYKAECTQPDAADPCGKDSPFLNILITDGQYNSTDAQVAEPLKAMYADGVTTYVIGFGEAISSPMAIAKLHLLADAGSGDTLDYYDTKNQAQLELALADIIGSITFDPCCLLDSCYIGPPPGEPEPDPLPPEPDATTDGTSGGTSGGTTTSDGTTTSTGTSTQGGTTELPTTTDEASTSGADESGSSTGISGDSTAAETPTPTSAGPDDTTTAGATTGPDPDDGAGCGCTLPGTGAPTRGSLGTLLAVVLGGGMCSRRRRARA